MSAKWKEIVALHFEGKRFAGRALDLDSIQELTKFQRIVTRVASELWHRQHPDRANLPRQFESHTRLFLRRITSGSAVAHLETFDELVDQQEMFAARSTMLEQAVKLVSAAALAAEKPSPLPEALPRSVIPDLANWGSFEEDDEAIRICTPGHRPIRFSKVGKNRIRSFIAEPYEDIADLTGEVFEADVLARRFQILLADHRKISVSFTADQEQLITSALKDHKVCQLRATGTGLFSTEGELVKVVSVDRMTVGEPIQLSIQPSRSIGDELDDLARQVPEEEWRKLPEDLASNLDAYIYGPNVK